MNFLQTGNGTEMIFWVTAILGTVFFFLRIVMMIVGGFGDDVGSDPGDLASETGDSNVHHVDDSDISFKLVSLNSITGFIMMFGWAGLASYIQFQLNGTISFLIAIIIGTLCMFLTAYLFKLALKLHSPGAHFDIHKSVGTVGEVYLKIPAKQIGKVKLTVNDETRIVGAISEDKVDIDSFKTVKIISVIDTDKVSVKEI
ncbi:MAG: hypothetical protein KKA84_01750 [Bacteroidetes bacterium]|nr:hypothetical protein [Bacteroidota bacterium]